MGLVAAWAGVAEGIVYLLVIALLIITGAGMPPPEPYASVVAVDLLFSVPTFLAMTLALCWLASPGRRPWTVLALFFVVVFGVYVSVNRFLQVSLLRSHWGKELPPELALLHPYRIPSLGSVLEIVGWGTWLGLAFLAMAMVLTGTRRRRILAWTVGVCGVLSFVAGLAPIIPCLQLTTLGILAWGPGLLAVTVLLALEFRDALRQETQTLT